MKENVSSPRCFDWWTWKAFVQYLHFVCKCETQRAPLSFQKRANIPGDELLIRTRKWKQVNRATVPTAVAYGTLIHRVFLYYIFTIHNRHNMETAKCPYCQRFPQSVFCGFWHAFFPQICSGGLKTCTSITATFPPEIMNEVTSYLNCNLVAKHQQRRNTFILFSSLFVTNENRQNERTNLSETFRKSSKLIQKQLQWQGKPGLALPWDLGSPSALCCPWDLFYTKTDRK